MKKPNENKRQCSGFTLLEATMAMVLLAIAAAGILMPIAAAAAAQTEAQRRVVATRFAADVIEEISALDFAVIRDAGSFDIPARQDLTCQVQKSVVSVNTVDLIALAVSVRHGQKPMVTLKTLVGNQ